MANALIQGKHPTTGFPLDIQGSPSHNGIVVTEGDHHLIHAGRMFYAHGKISALAAAASFNFHGLTSTGAVHFRAASIEATGVPIAVSLYEAADVTANGTPLTAYNRRRSSTNTPTLSTFTTPTIGGGGLGTEIDSGAILVVAPSSKGGAASLFAEEWVLDKANTSYIISVTNNDSNPVDIYFKFIWYEVV